MTNAWITASCTLRKSALLNFSFAQAGHRGTAYAHYTSLLSFALFRSQCRFRYILFRHISVASRNAVKIKCVIPFPRYYFTCSVYVTANGLEDSFNSAIRLSTKKNLTFAHTSRISCAHKVTHTKRLSKVTLTVLFEPWMRFSCSHSMVTMALSCIVSEIKRDIGRGLPYAEENIMIMLSRFVTILKRDRRTNRIAISTRDKNNSIHSRFPCYR